jgi:glucose-6-phosphate isomerase
MSLSKINPTQTQAWSKLLQHRQQMKDVKMNDLFLNDASRYQKFSCSFNNEILVDFSKNRITKETIDLLIELANETDLKKNINSFFNGEKINETEGRAAMHMALRRLNSNELRINNVNVTPLVEAAKSKMKAFADQFCTFQMKGYSGKTLNTVVNIGIGGSDLGPVMVTEALKPYQISGVTSYFVSNVDGTHLTEILKKVNFEETLFIVASKTFTTQETMANAKTAKDWLIKNTNNEAAVASHFVALSTNQQEVKAFGILPENIFEFWDWVGGRYSLWSSIGLSIACSIGYDNFEQLLQGAGEMDEHFYNEPFEKNIPIILALLGIWYNNFWDAHSHAILPYDQYMHRFAAYFQQGDMESNGKRVDRNGNSVNYQTGPIIWGEPGTNGQHAFYQLIHQGTKLIPCDFIAPANSHHKIANHHQLLLSNFFAQTQALMCGKSLQEAQNELKKEGLSENEMLWLAAFKEFQGNIPTNSILVRIVDPKTLGALIAMYEHKIFVQGAIWNIFSFDQWGVELGKQLASKILPELIDAHVSTTGFDSSTNGLINQYKKWAKA